MREYATLWKLRAGEIINFHGIMLKMVEGDIKPGDLYIAERNTGPHLLTAREINRESGYIVPTTPDYPFDLHECVKVCEA